MAFRPFPGQEFSITGSETDAGVVGELERSGGFYQRDLAALLQDRLASDAVVVDVGAHIGVVTVLLAGLCPKGHVHSFEPVAENHAHLTANVAANELDNVTVHQAALFDTDGEISVRYDAVYPGGSHVGGGGATVPAVRFDTWAARQGLDRLDLVKLDVEGVELAVLAGAAETLRRFRPILVVECNPVALPRFGGTGYAALLRRMQKLFPLVAVIGAGGKITPVASVGHLRLILGQRGVIDLVGLPTLPNKGVMRQRLRTLATRARTLRADTRQPPEPAAENFVVDAAGIRLRPAAPALSGAPDQTIELAVELTNGSRWWLSSAFAHPINISYRWLDDSGAPAGDLHSRRTHLPAPLGRAVRPGSTSRSCMPPAPGRYTLVLTLVQEHFCWLDDLDPGCAARIPVTVAVDEA